MHSREEFCLRQWEWNVVAVDSRSKQTHCSTNKENISVSNTRVSSVHTYLTGDERNKQKMKTKYSTSSWFSASWEGGNCNKSRNQIGICFESKCHENFSTVVQRQQLKTRVKVTSSKKTPRHDYGSRNSNDLCCFFEEPENGARHGKKTESSMYWSVFSW